MNGRPPGRERARVRDARPAWGLWEAVASLANRLHDEVGEAAFRAVRAEGHDREIPVAGLQPLDDVSLEADGADVHRMVELPGARAVIDTVASQVHQRRTVRVGGRSLPGESRAPRAAAQALARCRR